MALNINNGSIVYPNCLIPTTGDWTLLYRATIHTLQGEGGAYLIISNGDGSKKLTLKYFNPLPNAHINSGYYLTWDHAGVQNIQIEYGDTPKQVFYGIVQYLSAGSQIRLWNLQSAQFVSMTLSSTFSDMTTLSLVGNKVWAEDLSIWNTVWVQADVQQAAQVPPHLMKNKFKNLIFYERFFPTFNNPHRLSIYKPTYTNVTLDDYMDGVTRQGFPNHYTEQIQNNRTVSNNPVPTETTININHELSFSPDIQEQGTTTVTSTLNDYLIFINSINLQNISTLNISNTFRFGGDIESDITIENIYHTLFLIEQWDKENDILVASQRMQLLSIIEEITMLKEISRNTNNTILFHLDMNAYKHSNYENYGE